MKNAADLTTFILASLKDEEGGRVALYHYLKNFAQPADAVTPTLINQFYAEALQLPHWQENKSELQADVLELLQRFFTQAGQAFRLDLLWDISRMQLLLLALPEDLHATVKAFEQALTKDGENFRVMQESENRALCIRRLPGGEITVKTYNNLVRVKGSSLLPLCADQELHYDPGLELSQNRVQRLRPSPHSVALFHLTPQGAKAQIIAGFAFRQNQSLELSSVSDEPRIFYALKKLERFYVNRATDPYYLELVGTLDKALRMIQTRTEGALGFARQAFDGGQIAFDQLFPDDKGLYVRLRELARWIATGPLIQQEPPPADQGISH